MTALTKAGTLRKRCAPGTPMAGRIILHTDRSGECWLWTATVDANGYARLYVDKRMRYAHRVSYEAFVGPIPDGLHIDHLCRVRHCVNPGHLDTVTCLENIRRSPIHVGARTVCPYGHDYDEVSTYRSGGRRQCKPCRRVYMRLYFAQTPGQRAERKSAGLPVVDLASYFAEQTAA